MDGYFTRHRRLRKGLVIVVREQSTPLLQACILPLINHHRQRVHHFATEDLLLPMLVELLLALIPVHHMSYLGLVLHPSFEYLRSCIPTGLLVVDFRFVERTLLRFRHHHQRGLF